MTTLWKNCQPKYIKRRLVSILGPETVKRLFASIDETALKNKMGSLVFGVIFMKTYLAKPGQEPIKRWLVIDAANQIVGRLAVQIANILRGKHRPQFTPHHDTGEFVVVLNASQLVFTGKKMATKTYRWYTHFPGGLRSATAKEWLANHPDRIIREAVKRMMPRSPLGRQQIKKLKIYAGSEHPHQAQQPIELKV